MEKAQKIGPRIKQGQISVKIKEFNLGTSGLGLSISCLNGIGQVG